MSTLKSNGLYPEWVQVGNETNNGMSLYPTTTNWASLNKLCLDNMNDRVKRYGKEVMLCEVGMDVTQPLICKEFLTDTIKKTKSVTDGKGIRVFYWKPECYGDWNEYYKGAFDSTGKPTVALDVFL